MLAEGRLPAGALVLALLLPACAINPVTQRREMILTSVATERETGKQDAKQIEESIGLAGDPELRAYVARVGARLARFAPESGFAYEFKIIDLVEPNAFALPGGFVYVSRGLLALASSEDELAAVMAHELGHAVARHSAQRATVAAPFAILTGLTSAATGIVSEQLGRAVGGLGQLAGNLVLAPYSRDQEREADRFAVDLLGRAGWDPEALPVMLATLEREGALHGGSSEGPQFLSSHPSTPERVADTKALAASTPRAAGSPIAPDRAAFLAYLNGLLVGDDPSEGVFVAGRFLQPELGFTLRFPAGWKTANDREAVMALSPDERTIVGLANAVEAGKGADPVAAARAYGEKLAGAPFQHIEQTTIAGLAAAHVVTSADTRDGRYALDLTWIAHRGHVYRVVALSPLAGFESMRPTLVGVAQSFRSITPGELASVGELRLRIVAARRGESLAHLVERTSAGWSVAQTAVANGLEESVALADHQLVKVTIRERYRPRR
jgi:predicted Zn-dependent protease